MNIKQNSLSRIIQAFKEEQFRSALALCMEFLQEQPQHARALLLMSAIQFRLSDKEASLACLKQADDAFGTDQAGKLDVATAMQRIGAFQEAGALLGGLNDTQAGVLTAKARHHWLQGNYQPALEGFKLANQRWPGMEGSYRDLARALSSLGKRDEAEAVTDEGLERFFDSHELQRLKIACLLDAGDGAAALIQARSAMLPDAESRLMLAALNAWKGKPGKDSPGKSSGFNPLPAGDNARLRALLSSHHWVLDNAPQVRWFGTGTGLLQWAADNIPEQGLIVECGVYHGLSINLLATGTDRPVHGFDSFRGLPEDWKNNEPAGSYSTRGQMPETPDNVSLHAGWFEDSLPDFADQLSNTVKQPIALLHIDCDLYSSTRTVLQCLGPHLAHGSLIVFDDFLSYPGYENHELKAAQEYIDSSPQKMTAVAAVMLGRSFAYRLGTEDALT